VCIPNSGNCQLTLRYANGAKGNRTTTVVADGSSVELALPITGEWLSYADSAAHNAYRSKGNHLLDFTSTAAMA
jgi:hypothetical protein